jgi:hypothetical protein
MYMVDAGGTIGIIPESGLVTTSFGLPEILKDFAVSVGAPFWTPDNRYVFNIRDGVAVAQDPDAVAERLDLAEDVRRQEHRLAAPLGLMHRAPAATATGAPAVRAGLDIGEELDRQRRLNVPIGLLKRLASIHRSSWGSAIIGDRGRDRRRRRPPRRSQRAPLGCVDK